MKLENIIGGLESYNELRKGTFLHVDELMRERRENPELAVKNFYSADGNGYFLREDGGIDWIITREEENLVLRHMNEKSISSCSAPQNGNYFQDNDEYFPSNGEADAARNAKSSIAIDMDKLRLFAARQKDSDFKCPFAYLRIRPKDGFVMNGRTRNNSSRCYKPNEEETKAMGRLGYSAENLKALRKAGIMHTEIIVANPHYTKEKLKDAQSGSLWLASWIYGLGSCSHFYASSRYLYVTGFLRGVVKSGKCNVVYEE